MKALENVSDMLGSAPSQKYPVELVTGIRLRTKVVEERCSGDWVINTTFEVKDIIKETEKAFFVEMKVGNLVTGKDSKWTKNVWIPKSACF